ncbi:hypothetical protein L7F22_017591 [Adiantum nelumboides]|nr:hypothetical protein [Adiantum nelumboides]
MAQWLCLLIAFLFVPSALVQGLNKPDPDAIKSEFSVVPEETASVELQDEQSPFSSLLSDIKTAGDFEASNLTAHSGDSSLTSILTQNGLPIGLLPSAVESYSLSEDGKFFVSLSTACYADFDYEVYYAETITGTLSYGAISDLSGIQAKKAFLWLPVTGIRVDDSSSSYIYFNVGPFSKKLCISQFESVRVCKAKAANIRFS